MHKSFALVLLSLVLLCSLGFVVIRCIRISQSAMIDNHTLEVLDFSQIRTILADLTQTEIGRRKALNILPEFNRNKIEQDLAMIEELLKIDDEPPISQIPELGNLLKTEVSYFNPLELLVIKNTISALATIKEFFVKRKERLPLIYQKVKRITDFSNIGAAITQAITDDGSIIDNASPELYEIRNQLKTKRQEIISRLEKILSENEDFLQERNIMMKGDRYVLPVKIESQDRLKGILHDYSATKKTVFLEPLSVVDAQNELIRLKRMEQEAIKRVLLNLSNLVISDRTQILESLTIIYDLDLLFAKKRFAQKLSASKPEITDDHTLVIKDGRHPLLFLTKKEAVVPLDFTFPKDAECVLISGPNAGGKTVVLKTIGLFNLMLGCGMFLPCQSGTKLPLFQKIFALIGDEQSVEKDLSSFSANINRIKEILDSANSQSLVLLDEIGSSTDPDEGSALSMAILEELRDRQIKTLATTHLSRLKLFVQNSKGIINGAMEFLGRPTYRLIIGIPGESSALVISKDLGLSEKILAKARNYLSKDQLILEDKIRELTFELEKNRSLNAALTTQDDELKKLRSEYEEKLQRFNEFTKEERRKLNTEKRRILLQTRTEIENLVREIKESCASKPAIVAAKRYIDKELKESEEAAPKQIINTKPFKLGDSVYSKTFKRTGLVTEIKSGEIVVAFGNIKIGLKSDDLQINGQQPKKERAEITCPEENFDSKLNIRGMDKESARLALEQFLADARIYGVKRLVILHGKGKGILKDFLWNYLRQAPDILEIRFGEPFEGGTGVTKVTLK